jgi:hypothetical protein
MTEDSKFFQSGRACAMNANLFEFACVPARNLHCAPWKFEEACERLLQLIIRSAFNWRSGDAHAQVAAVLAYDLAS